MGKCLLIEGSTAVQVQLEKITSEIKVDFLVRKIEITPCVLW